MKKRWNEYNVEETVSPNPIGLAPIVAQLKKASLTAQLRLKRIYGRSVSRRTLYNIGEQIVHQQNVVSGGTIPWTQSDLFALYELLYQHMIETIVNENDGRGITILAGNGLMHESEDLILLCVDCLSTHRFRATILIGQELIGEIFGDSQKSIECAAYEMGFPPDRIVFSGHQ